MTATEKLATILKQFVITPQSEALNKELQDLMDIHKAEATELQTLRDDYATLLSQNSQLSSAIGSLANRVSQTEAALEREHDAWVAFEARVTALEQRNTSDDQVADAALAGFTGQPNAIAPNTEEPVGSQASGVTAPETTDESHAPPADPVAESGAAE